MNDGFVKIKCQYCKSMQSVKPGLEKYFCKYCGKKIDGESIRVVEHKDNKMHLSCPACAATLNSLTDDDDGRYAICEYCGTKVFLDIDQMKSVLIAKEQTKQAEIESNKEIEIKKIELEQFNSEQEYNEKESERSSRSSRLFWTIWVGALAALVLIPIGVFCIPDWIDIPKENELKKLNLQIEQCLEDMDYEKASEINNQLKISAGGLGYSSNIQDWDSQYKENKIAIEKLRREVTGEEALVIKMTQSASSLRKMGLSDVKEYLLDIGYLNVQSVPVQKGVLDYLTNDPIENISINGEKYFDVGAEFPDDCEVIIYFFI